MSNNGLGYFIILKKHLEKYYKEHFPECETDIIKWPQKEINRFQELMSEKINDRISEKWFYTHIKNENNERLPRIDTLNLLCRFLGYENWDDFIQKNELTEERSGRKSNIKTSRILFNKKVWYSALVISLIATVIIVSKSELLAQKKYSFCFVDSDSGQPITDAKIEVFIIHKEQSNELIQCNSNACFEYETDKGEVKFVVKASYYKTDTITRYLNSNKTNESISLKPDDYALMIHVFSSSKIEDWEKRRTQLDEMIAENARFIQVDYQEERGIEIYNKEDFINKLTMPINSLKNLKIIQTRYDGDKIKMMRFVQVDE